MGAHMATAGSIVVDLLARTGSFETDIDRATKGAERKFREMEQAADRWAMKIAAGAAVAGTALVAWANSALQTGREIERLSTLSNTSAESFQKWTYAARTVGIEQEKLADIFKDMQDRVGDFLQTGGGPLADFFENIAPKVGVTIDQFRRLSGPEALGLFVSSLEKAKLSQNEMVFYMEAIASDSTALLPLLRNNAQALGELGDQASKLGMVLSNEAIQATRELDLELTKLIGSTGSLSNLLVEATAPALLETVTRVNDFIAATVAATGNTDSLRTAAQNLASFTGLREWLDGVGMMVATTADEFMVLGKTVDVVAAGFHAVVAMGRGVGAYQDLMNPFADSPSEAEFAKIMSEMDAAIKKSAETTDALVNMNKRVNRDRWQETANTIRLTSDAVALVDLTVESAGKSLDKKTKKLTDAEKAAANFRKEQERSLIAQYQSISAIHEQAEGLEDQAAYFGLSKTAIEDLTIARLEEQAAMLRGFDDSQEQVEAIEREIEARKRLRTAIGSLEQKEAERQAWEEWARGVGQVFQQVGQSLTDAIFDGGKSGLDLLKDWAKTLTLRVLIQPVMGGLQGLFMGAGPAGIANAGSAAGGMMGSPTSLFSMFGGNSMGMGMSNVMSHLSTSSMLQGTGVGNWLMGQAGNVAGMSNLALGGAGLLGGLGANLIFGGKGYSGIGGGLGSTVGMALGGPIGAVAGTLLGGGLGSLFGDREPTTRREQRTQVEYAGGLFDVTKVDDRAPAGADAAARALAEQAVQTANDIFRQVGVDAAIDSFHAIMASSYQGDRDGVASGGALRIGDELRKFGIAVDDENPTIKGFGGWSSADTLPRLATDIQLSVLEAFQSVSDELPSVLSGMLEGVDIRSLGEQEAQALAERFTALTQGAAAFLSTLETTPFAELRDLSFDAAAAMVQFAGGIDSLLSAQQTYYERFYSDAERHAHSVDQLSTALADVGVQMPALVGSTDDMLASYRALVESLDLNTEAGQQAYSTLMMTAGAFADVAQFAGQAAQRSLQEWARVTEQLYQSALGNLQSAYQAVTQAGQAEIARLQESFSGTDNAMSAYRSAVQRLEAEFNSLFSAIDRGVQALRGTGAAFDAQYNQARAVISTTLLTGQLPQTADLTEAISTAQRGVTAQRYSSLFEQQKAYLTLANEMEAIKEIAGPELDIAQATLAQLEDQYALLRGTQLLEEGSLEALEGQLKAALVAEEDARYQISLIELQLEAAREQYNAITGVNDTLAGGFASLSDALAHFAGTVTDAIESALTARAAANAAKEWSPYSYLAQNKDVADAYEAYAKGYGHTPESWAREHYEHYGKHEGRSFAIGTNYVPYDMTAQIHQGERIIPAADNRALIQALQGGGAADRETVQVLREQLTETRQQNRYLYELVKSGKRTQNYTEDTARALQSDSDDLVLVF